MTTGSVRSTRPTRLATFHESSRSLRVLKWIVLPFIIAHVVLATISGYRAIVQVYRVEIAVDASTLRAGTNIEMSVATSGRTPVDMELELIQATHAETLAVLVIRDHRNPSYDPLPSISRATIVARERCSPSTEMLVDGLSMSSSVPRTATSSWCSWAAGQGFTVSRPV